MWTCPKCGAQYFQKNLWHSCNNMPLEEWLKDKPERGIQLFWHFLREYEKIGPVTLHVLKSRIAFMVQIRFSGVSKIGRDHIQGAFLLTRSIPDKRFYRIEFIPRIYYLHRFKLYDESAIDGDFRKYMKMAYEVGERKHIKKKEK
jgi:hypothetical protein